MVKDLSPLSEKDLCESKQGGAHEEDKRHSSWSTLQGYGQKIFLKNEWLTNWANFACVVPPIFQKWSHLIRRSGGDIWSWVCMPGELLFLHFDHTDSIWRTVVFILV